MNSTKDDAQQMSDTSEIKSNTVSILNYFVEIDRISNPNTCMDCEPCDEDEDIDERISHLNRYYKTHQEDMETLLNNFQHSLKSCPDLYSEKHELFDMITDNFKWLINDYFSMDKSEDEQIKIWHALHNSISDKRYEIDNTLYQKLGC